MNSKRSVMLLIADDWSPFARCYGNPVVQTPHIDRLAERGTVFDNAFCTSPSCAASRANLLTGHYSHQHGQYGHCQDIHGFRTHTWMRTVPAVLKDAGIHTGLIGKSHIAPPEVYPFDVWRTLDGWSNDALGDGIHGYLDEVGDQSFYLHTASLYPHRVGPRFPPAFHGEEFSAVDVEYAPDEVVVPEFLPDLPEVRQDLAAYYRFVSRFDHFVGRAVEALESSGRREDTLIILLSDHGMPFPGAKASSFDTGHRCPLIIVDPTADHRGTHCSALVNWCDFAPTLYDWLGVEEALIPDDLPGRSLLPLLGQQNPAGWDETYFSHSFHEVTNYYPYRVLRGRRYKYVRNFAYQLPMPLPTDLYRSPTWSAVQAHELDQLGRRSVHRTLHHDREELYDLEVDPYETVNRIADPTLRDVVEEMRQRLLAFCNRTNDPWLEISFQEGEVEDPEPGRNARRRRDPAPLLFT